MRTDPIVDDASTRSIDHDVYGPYSTAYIPYGPLRFDRRNDRVWTTMCMDTLRLIDVSFAMCMDPPYGLTTFNRLIVRGVYEPPYYVLIDESTTMYDRRIVHGGPPYIYSNRRDSRSFGIGYPYDEDHAV